jgi:hypothetical protein
MRCLLVCWGVVVLVAWVIVTLRTGSLADLPGGVLGILTALIGAKAAQRFGEKTQGQ